MGLWRYLDISTMFSVPLISPLPGVGSQAAAAAAKAAKYGEYTGVPCQLLGPQLPHPAMVRRITSQMVPVSPS